MDIIRPKKNQIHAPKEIIVPEKIQPVAPVREFRNDARKYRRSKVEIVRNTKRIEKISQPKRWGLFGKIFLFVIIIGSVCFAMWAIYFFWKISETTQKITGEKTSTMEILKTAVNVLPSMTKKEKKPLQGQNDGRINILLLGKATSDYPGRDLTDTIMIASVDTRMMKVALLSIPRDFYVQIPETESFTKINALYQWGLNHEKEKLPSLKKKTGNEKDKNEATDSKNGVKIIQETIETVTGLPIHYYAIVDYKGFVQVIDALNGIHVNVERDILDTRYPGPHYSYQTFKLEKGLHTLDGETALKYVRERHSDPLGDFGRSYRQQQTIEAVKNKALSIETFLNPFSLNNLLNAASDNIRTNISLDEIEGFVDLLRRADTHNINNIVIDAWQKESLLRVSHVELDNGQRMFALVPRSGNYSEIQETAKNAFASDEQKIRREKIQQEDATIALFNYSANAFSVSKIADLLEDIGMRVRIYSRQSEETIQESIVLDKTSLQKPFSLDEIVKRVPAKKVDMINDSMLPSESQIQDADFVLIIGSDTIPKYNWKEASPEEYKNSDNDDTLYLETP